MYDEKIEALISAALADGVLTEKEKQVLFKRAEAEGIDLDEFEMVLDARLVELEKAEKEKAKAEKEKSAPKSTKYGDVRKCPVCGAMVPALAGVCPECGYEFSGVDANLSSRKLAELLLKEKNDDRKIDIIETFPIPNTKSDLFEFLAALQPRMRDVSDPLSKSYFKKYHECINKAKATFANDAIFKPYIDSFEQEKKKRTFEQIKVWILENKIIVSVAVVVIFILISSLCASISNAIKKHKTENQYEVIISNFQSAIDDSDYEKAQQAIDVDIDKIKGDLDIEKRRELYAKYGDFIPELQDKLIYEMHDDGRDIKEILRVLNKNNGHLNGYTTLIDIANKEQNYEILHSIVRGAEKKYKLPSDVLIKAGEYNKAEEALKIPEEDWWNGTTKRCETYCKFMEACIEDMCNKGNKKEAMAFVNKRIAFFSAEPKRYGDKINQYHTSEVRKRMERVINRY